MKQFIVALSLFIMSCATPIMSAQGCTTDCSFGGTTTVDTLNATGLISPNRHATVFAEDEFLGGDVIVTFGGPT